MKRSLGAVLLLAALVALTAALSPHFGQAYNVENLLRRSALFGIISLGAALVIVTGGIDLSIGALVCLGGTLLPWLLVQHGLHPALAVPGVLALGLLLGWLHGRLVSRLRLQPFLVTLCGLLVYRGLARGLTGDHPVGFRGGHEALRALGAGRVPLPGTDVGLPAPLLLLLLLAVLLAGFLALTVQGRWLVALGRNETAVRFAGIDTSRLVTAAYTLSGGLSALGGMLFVLDVGSAQPADFGSFFELYAIAAAVLGGVSLRGGEITVVGVLAGAAVMQVLRNAIVLVDAIPDHVEYAVIGGVILAGVVADELLRRGLSRRRTRPPPAG